MEINFNDKTLTLRRTMRAYLLWEQITGKPFGLTTYTDFITYFFATILASNPNEESITYDGFLDWLDSEPNALADFVLWLQQDTQPQPQQAKKKKAAK